MKKSKKIFFVALSIFLLIVTIFLFSGMYVTNKIEKGVIFSYQLALESALVGTMLTIFIVPCTVLGTLLCHYWLEHETKR